jgi:DNA-directed RNA polymerase subunit M/transcription elongation factor TFIIS
MTKGFFDDVDFDIDCPNCNRKLNIKANQVGSTITCRHCHAEIKLQDKNFKSEIKSANKAMNDFEKTLKSFK